MTRSIWSGSTARWTSVSILWDEACFEWMKAGKYTILFGDLWREASRVVWYMWNVMRKNATKNPKKHWTWALHVRPQSSGWDQARIFSDGLRIIGLQSPRSIGSQPRSFALTIMSSTFLAQTMYGEKGARPVWLWSEHSQSLGILGLYILKLLACSQSPDLLRNQSMIILCGSSI